MKPQSKGKWAGFRTKGSWEKIMPKKPLTQKEAINLHRTLVFSDGRKIFTRRNPFNGKVQYRARMGNIQRPATEPEIKAWKKKFQK